MRKYDLEKNTSSLVTSPTFRANQQRKNKQSPPAPSLTVSLPSPSQLLMAKNLKRGLHTHRPNSLPVDSSAHYCLPPNLKVHLLLKAKKYYSMKEGQNAVWPGKLFSQQVCRNKISKYCGHTCLSC